MNAMTHSRRILAPLLFAIIVFPFVALASIDTTLTYGDSGSQVRELQVFLIAKEFLAGPATGNFYGLTRAAVKHYQSAKSLPVTGIVGPMTRAAIKTDMSRNASADAAGSAPNVLPDAVTALTSQVAQLLSQIAELNGGTRAATSSITQTYATTSAAVPYDPSWRDAIVNLFCTARYGGYEDFSSGTGVVIDPRGVILTNAHVGFDWLFAHWPNPSLEECYVRIGSPAYNQYTARVLYIPDAWANKELANTFAADASSTPGEKDYALLLITGRSDPSAQLPASFPYLHLYDGSALAVNTPTYLMGYAAENLSMETLLRGLYLLTTPASVAAQRPIGAGTTADVIAFSGPLISQHGASGGAVITGDGKAAGLMTFLDANYGDTTNARVLNAITTSYIMRDFAADNGITLAAFLARPDLASLADTFDAAHAAGYQENFAKQLKDRGYTIPGGN